MTNWEQASAELSKKLDPAHVKGRKQGGGQVQYIEGWHAISEANRIFGFGAWDRETVDIRLLGQPRDVDGKARVDYMARVRISVTLADGETVIRDGCGFGQGIDRDVGQAHESALKEAETDAMKRAMMTFGNPFGLALYDKARENVGTNGPTPDEAKTSLLSCNTLADLQREYGALYRSFRAVAEDPEVIAAKDVRKEQLTPEQKAA